MSLIAPVRRVYHRWPMVMPLHDGRQCPDCGALVCGRIARRQHREWHMATVQWQEWAADTLIMIAQHVGIPVADTGQLEGGGDAYGRVPAAEEDDDDDEDQDDDDEA